MNFQQKKFSIINLPPLNKNARDEFAQLPADPYCGFGQRFRRFSQFILFHSGEGWQLQKLPHRPFIQSKEYNSYIGGVPRELEPLRIDPSLQIASGAEQLGLNTDTVYQVNVHQCRVITNEKIKGISVPEGPHRDGHEYGMLAVFDRFNIKGGESQLFHNGTRENPFFTKILEPNQALIYEDGEMVHSATDIVALSSEGGYRDIWIVAYNSWNNRRYGPEFETRAKQEKANA
ncbi:2OG-Fe dioxygenase family protein [Pseudomonas sp. RL_5y_Pfl2_73]|uniref:2OG-Fe dioxygenase family protein n=1 Tax=Pseudomonas sp. RL_5y_Pfl2_73 TaxID=3088713 RepID=UPI0030DC9AC5